MFVKLASLIIQCISEMKLHRPSFLHFLFIVIVLFHINLKYKFLVHFHYAKSMGKIFIFLKFSLFATALKHSWTALFTNVSSFGRILKLILSKIFFIYCLIINIWAVLHYHILRWSQLIYVWKTESTNWMNKTKLVISLRFFKLLV